MTETLVEPPSFAAEPVPPPDAPRLTHVRSLDGLRGVAVLAVVFYHFAPDVMPGGFLGVDLFFVLSGFLITSLLVNEWGGTSRISLSSFWIRRARRLVPALFLVLVAVGVYALLVPDKVDGQRFSVDGLSALGYVANWRFISSGQSYIDQFLSHTPSPLRHTWSLAIEEQFYLVWPLVVWLCPPRLVAPLCAVILVAEPIARIYARAMDTKVLWIYLLTWYRLDGLAIGAFLALAARRGLLPLLDRWVPAVVIVCVAGLIVCAIMGGHTWWWNRWIQQYGYSLIAVAAGAMLVSAVTRPADSLWPRMLSAGWLRAFGKYSFCLYLIHLPVMRVVMEYVLNPAEYETLGIARWIAQGLFYGAATAPAFGLAWLSWRLFEAPILRLKARFPY
jgi:peptidoglycan/LPS O-acetylase OafA/YrhL